MIEASDLNRRVSLLVRTQVQDEANQPIYIWSEFAKVWASIRTQSGMETIKAGGERPIVRASIRIRYRRGLPSDLRVQHGDDLYAVQAVLADEVGRENVDLVCRLLAPNEVDGDMIEDGEAPPLHMGAE